jgi:transcriptional regulator with XRE-family HTH domain
MAKTPLRFSGTKLLALRAGRGWYQRDLSDKTADAGHRVNRERISLYENGRGTPGARAFGALVVALGCTPDDLLDTETSRAVA